MKDALIKVSSLDLGAYLLEANFVVTASVFAMFCGCKHCRVVLCKGEDSSFL